MRSDMDSPTDLFAEIADVLRCTAHITERDIRAKYIATDLRLRGFVIQRAKRDKRGRFAS